MICRCGHGASDHELGGAALSEVFMCGVKRGQAS